MQPVPVLEEKKMIIQSASPRANEILDKHNYILAAFEALKLE